MRMLFGRCERHERIETLQDALSDRPNSAQWRPTWRLYGAFLIRSIGILDDKRLQPLRMRRDDAKADRPAIVTKEEGACVDLELLEETVDWFWPNWQRCTHMTMAAGLHSDQTLENPALSDDSAYREQGMSVSNSARGRRKPVQEHDHRRVLRTGSCGRKFRNHQPSCGDRSLSLSTLDLQRRLTNGRRRRGCRRNSRYHNFAPCRPGARSFRF